MQVFEGKSSLDGPFGNGRDPLCLCLKPDGEVSHVSAPLPMGRHEFPLKPIDLLFRKCLLNHNVCLQPLP